MSNRFLKAVPQTALLRGTLAIAVLSAATLQVVPEAKALGQPKDKSSEHAFALPPIFYLESLPWMNWQSRAPGIKADFLLHPEQLKIHLAPGDTARSVPNIS